MKTRITVIGSPSTTSNDRCRFTWTISGCRRRGSSGVNSNAAPRLFRSAIRSETCGFLARIRTHRLWMRKDAEISGFICSD
jgi:hypothetical protein